MEYKMEYKKENNYDADAWAIKMNFEAHKPKGGTEVKLLIFEDFVDFNRIFYLEGNPHMEESLLLFSRARQQFMQMNSTKYSSTKYTPAVKCEIDFGGVYEEVEIYDDKLFCVCRKPLALDVFFSSKKRRFFHKRSFLFKDKDLEFKGQIRFIIWKHDEADMGYRCLLGPLKDGRFIHFTLGRKSFSNQEPKEQSIDRVFFVSLALDSEKENPPDIAAALKPDKNTVLCFDKEKKYFFEYGEFAGMNSMKLETLNCEKIRPEKLNRMYLHYPYDHYPKSVKMRIKKGVSPMCRPNTDVDKFARNRYKEILLCMEDKPLYAMHLANRDRSFDDKEFQWEIHDAAGNQIIPIDITIDKASGRIYALCPNGIYYYVKQEPEEETTSEHMRVGRESRLLNMDWPS